MSQKVAFPKTRQLGFRTVDISEYEPVCDEIRHELKKKYGSDPRISKILFALDDLIEPLLNLNKDDTETQKIILKLFDYSIALIMPRKIKDTEGSRWLASSPVFKAYKKFNDSGINLVQKILELKDPFLPNGELAALTSNYLTKMTHAFTTAHNIQVSRGNWTEFYTFLQTFYYNDEMAQKILLSIYDDLAEFDWKRFFESLDKETDKGFGDELGVNYYKGLSLTKKALQNRFTNYRAKQNTDKLKVGRGSKKR